ncbi:NUDIX hydrolase [Candidatus Methylospira mobilis]|nr:NUDIX hydrolase [Candidatus Methylospira mobilis]WNV05802.1 NUDIX hydrolase [Candidatus Methylospira mobilis]
MNTSIEEQTSATGMLDISIQGRPRVTVAAIIERQGLFLMVEERNAAGELVINQPAGHVEMNESLVEAVIRETLEETAWHFIPEFLVGVYLWKHPRADTSFLRVCFAGRAADHDPARALDDGIEQAVWLSHAALLERSARLRSPLVLDTISDYLSGERYPLSVLKPPTGSAA